MLIRIQRLNFTFLLCYSETPQACSIWQYRTNA